MEDYNMKDSGERIIFGENKAMREPATGKGRYDLISPFAIKRLALVLEKGSAKYNDRNWEKGGIPFSRYIDSLKRHISQYEMGMEDEDHLGQAMYNLMCLLHFDELEDFSDDNLPRYFKKRILKSNEEKIGMGKIKSIEEAISSGIMVQDTVIVLTKSGENIDANQSLIDSTISKKNKKEKTQAIESKEEKLQVNENEDW